MDIKNNAEITNERIDELLSSLKADSPDFSKAVLRRINNERRFRTIRRITTASAAAVVIICAVPFIFESKADSSKSIEAPMMVYDTAEAVTEESCAEEAIEETAEVYSLTEGTDDSVDLLEDSMAKRSMAESSVEENFLSDVAECEPADGFVDNGDMFEESAPLAGNAEEDTDAEIVYASEAEAEIEEKGFLEKFLNKIVNFYKELFHII